MIPARLLPSAVRELHALDAGSQRQVLGAVRGLRQGTLVGHPVGGRDTVVYRLTVRQYVIVYFWLGVGGDARLTITEIALPGARDQLERLDEALHRLDALEAGDPRMPLLERAITKLAAEQPIIRQIRTSDDQSASPDLEALRQLRPRD